MVTYAVTAGIFFKARIVFLSTVIVFVLLLTVHHIFIKYRLKNRIVINISKLVLYCMALILTYFNLFNSMFAVLIFIFPNCKVVDGDIHCVMAVGQIAGAFLITVVLGSILLFRYIFKYDNIIKK